MYIWQCTQEIYNFDSSLIEFLCSSNKCRPSWITFRKRNPRTPQSDCLGRFVPWLGSSVHSIPSTLRPSCACLCALCTSLSLMIFYFTPSSMPPLKKNQPPSEKPGSATDHWKGASCLVTLGPELPSEVWWGAYSCIQLGPYTKKMMLF